MSNQRQEELNTKNDMEDRHITSLMPNSTGSIAVFGPINAGNPEEIITKEIKLKLQDPQVKHLIIPILQKGQGNNTHWQCLYITRGKKGGKIELYDPIYDADVENPFVTKTINQVKKLLPAVRKIDVLHSEKPQQTDSYSCGDYVVAHAHEMYSKFNGDLKNCKIEVP